MQVATRPARRSGARVLTRTAIASCLLGLLFSGNAIADGTIGSPTEVDANLSCTDFDTAGILNEVELLVDPVPEGVRAHSDGTLTVDTISFDSTNGWLLYWEQLSSGQSIHGVGISGGGKAVLYSYDEPVTADAGLRLPAVVAPDASARHPRSSTARFCYSVPQVIPFEGCTRNFWKKRRNHDVWPAAYRPNSKLRTTFGPNAFNDTFLEALEYEGGPGINGGKRRLLKQATAALLNSTAAAIHYPITRETLVGQVTAALASNDREIMVSLALTLNAYNRQGCPLRQAPE